LRREQRGAKRLPLSAQEYLQLKAARSISKICGGARALRG
jgi:hypothetical protein